MNAFQQLMVDLDVTLTGSLPRKAEHTAKDQPGSVALWFERPE